MPKSDYLNSIYSYHLQFETAYKEMRKITLPEEMGEVNDIIIAGMGGSSFGGRMLLSACLEDSLLYPVMLLTDYNLPEYADENTLVILTSYSGNTEETLSVLDQARSRGCKIFGITSGGKLSNAINSGSIPGYVFKTNHNPSHAPRTAVGYVVGATFGFLSSLKAISFADIEAEGLVDYIESFAKVLKENNSMPKNIAEKMMDKLPVFVAAEHLRTGVHIWRNFLNETAKNMGFTVEIPAMNHHFLDGLLFPNAMRKQLLFIYVLSDLYGDRNKKRFSISNDITKKQGIGDISLTLGGKTRLQQLWELVMIGSLVSYELAEMRGVNPSTNEMVDYLKSHL